MTGIYKITSLSGKIYIGSSIDIQKRVSYYNTNDCSGQVRLYNSIKKYGWNTHILEIIEECSVDDLYKREAHYGNLYNVLGKNGLNCVLPKSNDIKIGVSDCTRQKMSASKRGNKNTFFGKTHTAETRKIISACQTGRKHSKEHIEKVSSKGRVGNSKIVLHKDYGIFYKSAKEVSLLFSITHSTLKSRLNGSLNNNTSFVYA